MNNYPWLDAWLLDNPGAVKDYKAEWDWHRYLIDGKLFAATCQPGPEHKGWDCRELVNLKCDPMLSELLRSEYPDIRPGFYSNKRHWISVFLDGTVPEEVLKDLCTRSYQLVFSSLTKKRQREILAQE